MTTTRLSRLQKRMLCWLSADERRTGGVIASSHQELVQAVPSAKGNIGHSLRLLETQGLIRIGRSLGGQEECVTLTSAGRQKASQLIRKLWLRANHQSINALKSDSSGVHLPLHCEGHLVKASTYEAALYEKIMARRRPGSKATKAPNAMTYQSLVHTRKSACSPLGKVLHTTLTCGVFVSHPRSVAPNAVILSHCHMTV